MKCGSCNIKIGSEFRFAIQNNQCPACGKAIMQKERLASYLSLRTLLENSKSIPEKIDSDRIASLIVANFDVRQIFQDSDESELQKVPERGNIEVEEEVVPDPDDDTVIMEDGIKLEKIDRSKIKALQDMRDAALNDVLSEKNLVDFADDEIPTDDVGADQERRIAVKQQRSRNIIGSGSGGSNSFRRSE